jgi:predicted ArsR family transcriptional regulator
MVILGPTPSRFDPRQAHLSPERARVLEAMQSRESPASVGDVAYALALHENTVRKHLDGLVDRGLLVCDSGVAVGRGRPARAYSALPQSTEPDARVREYVGLATALARHISTTSDDPRGDAITAGETWGVELAHVADSAAVRDQPTLESLLGSLGFAPERDAADGSMALRRCPLLDAVHAEPVVVCAVHLGLVRGIVTALGGDPDTLTLHPFSEVGACRLHTA